MDVPMGNGGLTIRTSDLFCMGTGDPYSWELTICAHGNWCAVSMGTGCPCPWQLVLYAHGNW